ncbi:MAG: hypothetical protein HYZ48_01200 [Chlamydiales bacterium]|nr:hypothetical protein [Chlamydiales bacterium]
MEHIRSLTTENTQNYMRLDRSTQRNLELITPLQEAKEEHTLFHLLDETATPMGGRLLKQWLTHPLLDVQAILDRQKAISSFHALWDKALELDTHLENIRDLERLMMRIETGYATPRDLTSLRFSLEAVPPIIESLAPFDALLLQEGKKTLENLPSIASHIAKALVDTPPLKLNEGNLFKEGFHEELDALRCLRDDNQSWIANYQIRLKETTQIKTLKVGYTKAFGFYIEVANTCAAILKSTPNPSWQRRFRDWRATANSTPRKRLRRLPIWA